MSDLGGMLFGGEDSIGSKSLGGGGGDGDGTQFNPFSFLNIKKVLPGKYYKIREDLESVVTRSQQIDGVLTIDGVNTIL